MNHEVTHEDGGALGTDTTIGANDSTPQPNLTSTSTQADATESSVHHLNLSQKGSMSGKAKQMTLILSLVAIVAGSLTGFGVWQMQNQSGASSGGGANSAKLANIQQEAGDNIQPGDVFGSPNTEDFKDSAEGYLTIGGLDGEGSHNLQRPGGASQTVYLTSSVTDLDDFDGMEVKIWGETQKGQKAGWLMDVGRVEVVRVDGEAPVEN